MKQSVYFVNIMNQGPCLNTCALYILEHKCMPFASGEARMLVVAPSHLYI